MSGPSPVDARTEEWESLVGKAILRFGDVELVSLNCLALLPADKIAESTARLDFSRRADLIIEILENRSNRDANVEAMLSGFRQAKKLAATRNLIAHNPLMLDVYVNHDETEVLT